MHLLPIFIGFCFVTYFFNKYKNRKLNRNKTIINVIFVSILQVVLSDILVIISLRLIKGISLIHIFHSLSENRIRFLIKFSIINFICLSIILFLSLLLKTEVKKEKTNRRKTYIFSFIFVFFLMLFLMFVPYMNMMFPDLDIDQVLFVLTMPIKCASSVIIAGLIVTLLVIPLAFSIFHIVLLKTNINFTYITRKNKERTFFPFNFKHKILLSVIFVGGALLFFNIKLNFLKYILKELKGNTTFYEENYISPKDIKFTFPEHKKNLIFIYIESMEAEPSYCAKQGTNIIPELAELAKNNLSFSHSDDIGGQMQVVGTTHSIASVCCTHTGLPLLVDVTEFYKKSEHFFNGAYGLGNILHGGGGYNCLFSIGSDLDYGGLGVLLQTHGFETKDINYYKSIKKVPENYCVWWGIEDAKMIKIAKEELTKISSLEKPFAFSIFFEDTHFPGGYVDEQCEEKYPKQIHNVFANMSKRIHNFVNWIQEQPFYQNSVIVILGDHLYMGDDLYDDQISKSKRHAYNVFINTGKSAEHSKNRDFCTFDYFPTILDCLDIKYESDGLGLGRSLLTGKPTLLEQLGKEKLEDALTSKSNFYRYSLLNKR